MCLRRYKILFIFQICFLPIAYSTFCYNSHCNPDASGSPCQFCPEPDALEKWNAYVNVMIEYYSAKSETIDMASDLIEHFHRLHNKPICCQKQTDTFCIFRMTGEIKDVITFGCSRQVGPHTSWCDSHNKSTCCSSNYCNIPDDIQSRVAQFFPPPVQHIIVPYFMIVIGAIVLVVVCFIAAIFYFSPRSRSLVSLFFRKWRSGWQSRCVRLSEDDANRRGQIHDCDPIHASDCMGWHPRVDLESTFTGSGAGQPLLVNRTISRQISLKEVIGEGHFGTVFVGDWRGEQVAVKVFHSYNEHSWLREVHIYSLRVVTHPAILRYIAHDINDAGTLTELWLVTEYHPNGSLFAYLSGHTISEEQMLRMAHSVACGLDHLHMEFRGAEGKPSIAHRDIKSRNVLVKSNGECCLADFGLSIVQREYSSGEYFASSRFVGYGDSGTTCLTATATTSLEGSHVPLTRNGVGGMTNNRQVPPPIATVHVGTRRYMAPELLKYARGMEAQGGCLVATSSPSENAQLASAPPMDLVADPDLSATTTRLETVVEFEVFKQADIYSLGLVYWEMLRRCHAPPSVEASPCMLPFQDVIEHDPTAEEMRLIVCEQNRRPLMNPAWKAPGGSQITAQMAQLVDECWHHEPSSRHSAMRLKKTLASMLLQCQTRGHVNL